MPNGANRPKKLMAMLIACIMLFVNILSPVYAALPDTLHQSPEENQAILDSLKRLYGQDTTMQEAKDELERLGLLDETGLPGVTATVNVDGQQLSLSQVRDLVFAEGADLDKLVTVDGLSIPLGDLKTMIEIEDELQRIKETYFSDVTLNADQQKALQSLRQQIEAEGIVMRSGAAAAPEAFPSGIDHTLTVQVDVAPVTVDNTAAEHTISVTLKNGDGDVLEAVPGYDIAVSYRFVDGSAKKGVNYTAADGSLVFPANSPVTTQTLSFSILPDATRFEGQKIFAVQFFNPQNARLQGGKRAAEKLVKIQGTYIWTVIKQFASGSVSNRDRDFLTYIRAPFLLDYTAFSQCDMFAEGLLDKVDMTFNGTVSIVEPSAAGPSYVTPTVFFGYPATSSATYKAYPSSPVDMPAMTRGASYPISMEGRILFDAEAYNYIRSAQEHLDSGDLKHGQFVITVPGSYYGNMSGSYTLTFVDSVAPTVNSITVPSGILYEYGQSIPITVEYSEPMDLSTATLTANGEVLTSAESATRSRLATFLYPVLPVDSENLLISNISGAKDIYGNTQVVYEETFTAEDIIKGINKADAFGSASAAASLNAEKTGMTVQVSMELADTDPEAPGVDVALWLTNEASVNGGLVPSLYASADGGVTRIPLSVNDMDNPTALVGSFTEALNTGDVPITRGIEFFLDPTLGSTSAHQLMIGSYALYTLSPVTYLAEDDFSITYESFPADGILFAEDGLVPKLGIALADGVSATWMNKTTDFTWQSSNTSIASISANGSITVTGTPGTATFSLTAKNGGVAGKAVTITSNPLTVKVGLKPFLKIPESANVISIKSGEAAEVRWISNLAAKNAEEGRDTDFTIKVHAADYMTGVIQKGALIHEHTLSCSPADPVSSYTIPSSFLSAISAIGRHSYVVEVSATDPISHETLTAAAYISVFSKPAIVKISKLDSYYITDQTASVPISWTLEHFDVLNDAEFQLTVTHNASSTVVYQSASTENEGGSYSFAIPEVANGFKDIYTVSVKAKNAADSTWSYDSFVLHVYSHNALRILVDGNAAGLEEAMSNRARFSGMSSEAILALQRDIYLRKVISINYGEHAWGQISDQIRWISSDNGIASINYRQGSLYENIENFSYVSYKPSTEFILSGLGDGTARITATHAATGLSQTVNVRVETLKDRLYLFQVYPRAVTEMNYRNGSNVEKTVYTNENGELALYEETGIQGDVFMQSTFDGKDYRGTLYKERLVSSEKDSTKLQLYPVNNIKLREVAIAELHLKKPDGTPYKGEITLRGGVYKNDVYCPEAKLNAKSGEADQTVMIGPDGKLVIRMDATQFWTASDLEVLTPKDDMSFVYELRFQEEAYYPRQLRVSGNLNGYDTVHFGIHIIPLKAVPEGEAMKPFIDEQYVLLDGMSRNVQYFSGKIGPGQNSESVTLITRVIYWGESGDPGQGLHNLVFDDQFGVKPIGQSAVVNPYPFTTLRSMTHTFKLDKDTMRDWLKPFESRNMSLAIHDGDGNQYRKLTMPFKIVNMLDTPPVEEDNSLAFTLETLTDAAQVDVGALHVADKILSQGLNLISGQGTNAPMFGMVLKPTEDPTAFRALIFLDVGNMSHDNVTGVYSDDRSGDDLDYTPSLKEMSQMSKGEYKKKQKELNAKNKKQKKAERARELSYSIGGFMEAEVYYDDEKDKWEVVVINGGFNAGGGVNYKWNYNAFVGPVPITGQFGLGATLEVIFKVSIQRGEEIKITYDTDKVNNYLTTLRVYAYFKAFAGFGFDYTVAALKIGVFGQVTMDTQFAWLNQPHISDEARTGQLLKIRGKVGIEFVAKFTFVSYEKILASKSFDIYEQKWNDWNYIQNLWKEIGEGSSGRPEREDIGRYWAAGETDLVPVAERTILEERDYLEKYDRRWGEGAAEARFAAPAFVLDPEDESAVKDLQTNAYPYSNPVLSDDGQILVYLSDADSTDVEDTEVRWTRLTGDTYPDGTPIGGFDGYGDSLLKIDGTAGFAAAAWVRQSESLHKEAGAEITYSDVALMSNCTEIMASIYEGGVWTTTRLTDNASPDLAPVVAAHGGRVMVAWRSVYAPDAANPLNFSGADSILYRIWEAGEWSAPQTLYNGTSGAVKGMDAAMLPDGTSAVAYTLDTAPPQPVSTEESVSMDSSMEAVYAIIDPDGHVKANVQLTHDTYLDQNPQLATVTLEEDQKWFVMGWHSVHDADGVSVNDIRLCAFNQDGSLHPRFIDSISSVNDQSAVSITPTFRFSKNAETLEDLSILWSEPADSGSADDAFKTAEKDLLRAVRFRKDGDAIFITSALDVAEMPDYTLINHFDAYNTGASSIKAVILGTRYDAGYEPTGLEEEGTGEDLLVASPVSGLYTAAATFQNRLEVLSTAVDYSGVVRGMRIPVQYTVFNAGLEPISSITIQTGENTQQYHDLHLLPNGSLPLTAYYDVPGDRVINPDYTVTASFDPLTPGSPDTAAITETLYLDIPDIGISQLYTTSEEMGKRTVQMALYNYSDVRLADGNRRVKVGFYSDSDCTQLVPEVTGQEGGQPITIDPAQYGLMDEGAYTRQFTFDIAAFVGAGHEIPSGGIQLYVRTWIEEPVDPAADPLVYDEIMEYYHGNNMKTIVFESLLERHDQQPVTLSTLQTNAGGITQAVVTVQNNSLAGRSSGNLVLSLLDSGGNTLETQQCYSSELPGFGLLSLAGEQTAQKSFTFSREGASLSAAYSDAVLDEENNADLSGLSMTGVPLRFESGITDYLLTVKNLSETTLTAVTEDPDASVSLNGTQLDMLTRKLNLRFGLNRFSLEVTAADGTTTKTYTVVINNIDTTKTPDSGVSDSDTDILSSYRPTILPNEGKAVLSLDSAILSQLMAGASANGNRIILAPQVSGAFNSMSVDLSGMDLSTIARSGGISLSIETSLFNLSLDPVALSRLASLNGSRITLSLETEDGRYVVGIDVDGKRLDTLGGRITAYIPAENSDNSTVARMRMADGSFRILRYAAAKNDILIVPLNGSAELDVIRNAGVFADTRRHSLRESVDFVTARGLFSGTGGKRFSPDMTMNRGMLVTVLGKLWDINPGEFGKTRFRDVAGNAYYAPYVEWAAGAGITAGVGGGRFAPEEAITREQLVTLLSRFLEYTGMTLSFSPSDYPPFSDTKEISSYAAEAVLLMRQAGIMEDENGQFNPKGLVTRAEIAQVLERLVKNLAR